MNPKQSPRYGLWILIAALPLIALSLYPAFLHYLGYSRESYDLFHNNYQIPPYLAILLIAICLPFAVFILLRLAARRKAGQVAAVGTPAKARIISVTPNGKKIVEGVNELWGVELELEIDVPGKGPDLLTVEHYVPVMEIPRFQPGATIKVRVSPGTPHEIVIL